LYNKKNKRIAGNSESVGGKVNNLSNENKLINGKSSKQIINFEKNLRKLK